MMELKMTIIKLFFVFFVFLQTTTLIYSAKERFAWLKECCLCSFVFRTQPQPKNNEEELIERLRERPTLVINTELPESEVPRSGTPRHYIQEDPNPMILSKVSTPSHASTQAMRSVESLLPPSISPNLEVVMERKDSLPVGGSPASTRSVDSTFNDLIDSASKLHHADSDDQKDPQKGWQIIDDPNL